LDREELKKWSGKGEEKRNAMKSDLIHSFGGTDSVRKIRLLSWGKGGEKKKGRHLKKSMRGATVMEL